MPERMDEAQYAALRLDNQLCFPLYAASREVIRQYRPHLDQLDLTYTQYITLMVLWAKGYICRHRSSEDERVVLVSLTEAGAALQDQALSVPEAMQGCVRLSPEEAVTLYRLLYKLLGKEPEQIN